MDSLSQNKQKLWLILFYQFISLSLFCSLVQRFPYEKAWKCFREGTIKRLLAYWIGKVQWRKKSNAKNITLTHIIYIIRTILFSREHSHSHINFSAPKRSCNYNCGGIIFDEIISCKWKWAMILLLFPAIVRNCVCFLQQARAQGR